MFTGIWHIKECQVLLFSKESFRVLELGGLQVSCTVRRIGLKQVTFDKKGESTDGQLRKQSFRRG
ncbi:hypothetical protein BIV59_17645 [Bacillus sp. MUM 13]|nr:hypothetical protein BIV59_17645 [Bacillus sp. MUM 13]